MTMQILDIDVSSTLLERVPAGQAVAHVAAAADADLSEI